MKQNKTNLYTKDSIESLDPLSFTRLKPGVYCGDTTYSTQLLVEIISNSIDEFRLGNCTTIDVYITKDKIRVLDDGQGFLVNEIREDGKTILEAAFSVLNTSGKYREDGTYEGTSLGSFGIGAKLATFLSHWLNVTSYRDNKYESIKFKEGIFDKRMVGNCPYRSGTMVEWLPSEEFFTYTEVEIDKVKDLFKTLVCLCSGLTINLTYNNEPEKKYYSVNGINDLIDMSVKGKEILKNRFKMQMSEGKNKMDFIMTYTSNYSSTIVPYVNTGLTESGPHITQVKTTLTREFNKFFREKKWLKDKDDNLSGEDIQEGMYLIFNMTAPNVAYDAQVKSRITKIDVKPFIQALTEHLQAWFINNEKEIKTIVDKALNARKAREAAKRAREIARKPKETGLKAKMILSDKFIDCVNKDPSKRNLLLVEG